MAIEAVTFEAVTFEAVTFEAVRFEAVTFDFWNTLVVDDISEVRDRRLTAWLGLLEGAGFAVERAALDAAHDVACRRQTACGGQPTGSG